MIQLWSGIWKELNSFSVQKQESQMETLWTHLFKKSEMKQEAENWLCSATHQTQIGVDTQTVRTCNSGKVSKECKCRFLCQWMRAELAGNPARVPEEDSFIGVQR